MQRNKIKFELYTYFCRFDIKLKIMKKLNKTLLLIAVIIFITACSGNKTNSESESIESKFSNRDFYSREYTVFGKTGKKVILFKKNAHFNFKNYVKLYDEIKVNDTPCQNNPATGTWSWADSLKFTILVNFDSGNSVNTKYSGIWKFSEDFESLTIAPEYNIPFFKYK